MLVIAVVWAEEMLEDLPFVLGDVVDRIGTAIDRRPVRDSWECLFIMLTSDQALGMLTRAVIRHRPRPTVPSVDSRRRCV